MSLAAEIGREFGLYVDLFKTTGGVFEIDIDDDRIFSKIKLGRFPEDGEVLHILKYKFAQEQAGAAAALQETPCQAETEKQEHGR